MTTPAMCSLQEARSTLSNGSVAVTLIRRRAGRVGCAGARAALTGLGSRTAWDGEPRRAYAPEPAGRKCPANSGASFLAQRYLEMEGAG